MLSKCLVVCGKSMSVSGTYIGVSHAVGCSILPVTENDFSLNLIRAKCLWMILGISYFVISSYGKHLRCCVKMPNTKTCSENWETVDYLLVTVTKSHRGETRELLTIILCQISGSEVVILENGT